MTIPTPPAVTPTGFETWVQAVTDDGNAASASLDAISVRPITEQTLGATANQIDFQGISQDYASLRITGRLRSATAAGFATCDISINNDVTDTNYRSERLQISGTTTAVAEHLGTSGVRTQLLYPAASATTGMWGYFTIDIHDYAETDSLKTLQIRLDLNYLLTTGGHVIRHCLLTRIASTEALNRLTFTGTGGSLFEVGTRIGIYGVMPGFL